VDDIEAIKRLKARYFRTMDTKDWTDADAAPRGHRVAAGRPLRHQALG